MAVNILSPQERDRLSTIPLEISDAELVRFFTLQQAAFILFDPRVSPSSTTGSPSPAIGKTSCG
jgi:hypothetical protein